MHKRGLCRCAVSICPSVCTSVRPFVTFVYSVEMNKRIFKSFSSSGSHTILVFPRQTFWQNSDGDPLTGASNAGGVGKSSILSQHLALSCSVNGSTAMCNILSCDGPWLTTLTLVAGKQRRLFLTRDDNEVFMTRSLDVTPKTAEQHLIERSDNSSETWTLFAADVKTLEAFHVKCQRQILRIRWQDHVRNDEVAARTGLRPVMESIRRRREAIFGHVARMSLNIPAHQALRLQVEASVGRRPGRDWVRSSGRPRNRWIDQLRLDHQRPPQPPADLWRAAIQRGHTGATLRSSTTTR